MSEGFLLAMHIEPADRESMVNKPFDYIPAMPSLSPQIMVGIQLTPARTQVAQSPLSFDVALSELIAYSEDCNHTRINLTGRRIVNVQETAQQIDCLVRTAATKNSLASAKAFLS
jgi:hypothetical protein